MPPRYWAPPLIWMGVIFLLSTDLGGAEHSSRLLVPLLRLAWPTASPLQLDALHTLLRKAAHVAEYAVLAALWYRALHAGRRWGAGAAAWAALGLSVAWALLDEAHQTLTRGRVGSPGDVALDAAGAALAATGAALGWRRAVERATGVLLWLAAGGGALALAVNLALDVPGGWLWVTTPLAVVGLVVRHRARRRRR